MLGDGDITFSEILGAAVIIPVVTLAAIVAARKIGHWFTKSITLTFAETVRDVMAPDMARLGTRLGQSVDDMKYAAAADNGKVRERLVEVEATLVEVKARLSAVESQLSFRPPDARTRSDDKQYPI